MKLETSALFYARDNRYKNILSAFYGNETLSEEGWKGCNKSAAVLTSENTDRVYIVYPKCALDTSTVQEIVFCKRQTREPLSFRIVNH